MDIRRDISNLTITLNLGAHWFALAGIIRSGKDDLAVYELFEVGVLGW